MARKVAVRSLFIGIRIIIAALVAIVAVLYITACFVTKEES